MSTTVTDLLLVEKAELELQLAIDEAALLEQESRAEVIRATVATERQTIADIDIALAALSEE